MSKNCPKCDEIIDEQDVICPNCHELTIEDNTDYLGGICQVCGAQNEQGSKSCVFCCSIIPEKQKGKEY
ncbi:MAG: hypothetical protein DRI95_11830 [Bacteroidetes bacterium]|nr:MAG: hypothetical protein DRI95_11830 [Bacteroidota bacterium]RLD85401.1 MAG: hypothetical protein DRJ07_03065 [Bacteroidota bacterium]